MDIEKVKHEHKEWITRIRLARYKSLSISTQMTEYEEKVMFKQIKQMLLEDGITEETINQEALNYSNLSEDERKKQIVEKVEVLVSQIAILLKTNDEIDSKDYPELYYRIEEIIALNPDLGNQLIKEAFERESINNAKNCSDSLYGGGCSYYFSKTLSYK